MNNKLVKQLREIHPEVSVVLKSDIDKAQRFDADYFSPKFIQIEKQLEQFNLVTLKDVSERPQFGTTPAGGTQESEGVPFIRSQDFKDYFVNLETVQRCTEEFHLRNKRSTVILGDILIACVGATVGELGLYLGDTEANTNQNIGRVRVNDKRISLYSLFVFLLSRFGNAQFKRLNTGNAKEYLNTYQLEKIQVPIFSNELQLGIERTVKTAHAHQEHAKTLYSESEKLLLSELGLLNYKPADALTYEATKKEVEEAERFDAEYFQPKYKQLEQAIRNYAGGSDTLGNLANVKATKYNPESDKQYRYIELSNISNSAEITGCTIASGGDLPGRARQKVKVGDVIVSSIEGSLSSIALIGDEYNDALCSTGFHVIRSDVINSETLTVLLKSIVGQVQLKRGCRGTILTGINRDDFSHITLPKLVPTVQSAVQSKVAESARLRGESKRLLEVAKRTVELAIEDGEAAATAYLTEAA